MAEGGMVPLREDGMLSAAGARERAVKADKIHPPVEPLLEKAAAQLLELEALMAETLDALRANEISRDARREANELRALSALSLTPLRRQVRRVTLFL